MNAPQDTTKKCDRKKSNDRWCVNWPWFITTQFGVVVFLVSVVAWMLDAHAQHPHEDAVSTQQMIDTKETLKVWMRQIDGRLERIEEKLDNQRR